jgi:hypothetical protein
MDTRWGGFPRISELVSHWGNGLALVRKSWNTFWHKLNDKPKETEESRTSVFILFYFILIQILWCCCSWESQCFY